LADVLAGVELGTPLPNQNVSSDDSLATVTLYSAALAVGITTVAAGALTFFMCHGTFTP